MHGDSNVGHLENRGYPRGCKSKSLPGVASMTYDESAKVPADEQELPMADVADTPQVDRFGVFEVDLRAGELRQKGVRLRLQEQPLQVLAVLLEQLGQLVTREQLKQRLWAGTIVDSDPSIKST